MKDVKKTTFAVLFGNRGFFPASLQQEAREQVMGVLHAMGHETIALPTDATERYGAVETPAQGRMFADFLRQNHGRFGGVILSLPNFGDETGAIAALKDCGVPILIQAFPDDLDRMEPALRRDAFCGKFSIMDVFVQYGQPFTVLKPHTVHPQNQRFAENIDYFDRLCRVYNGMKDLTVGAIGARTTAFKTVRIDELALQSHGITMETLDLSGVFARMDKLTDNDGDVKAARDRLSGYTRWDHAPAESLNTLSKLSVVLDQVIQEFGLDCLALRCWIEMQEILGISPCVLLSLLNDQGMAAGCEVDIGSAITMHALKLASGQPAACLDWNNNYGDDDDKCILFHCGSTAQSLMTAPGQIEDHAILANAVGEGCSFGCNIGRIRPGAFTYGDMLTARGELNFYLGQGEFTPDPIPDVFFGCAGVARIENMQDHLMTIGYAGHRHHTSVTPGHIARPIAEAFTKYLGYNVTLLLP
jgi:L-fucose isomerase-like protein